jgi:formate hydrogenlyase transcriptional activator
LAFWTVRFAGMCAESRDPAADPGAQRYRALLELADLMVQGRSLRELMHELASRLREIEQFDFIVFSLYDPAKKIMHSNIWAGVQLNEPPTPMELNVEDSVSGWVWEHQRAMVLPDLSAEVRFPKLLGPMREGGVRSYCMLPLSTANAQLGALGFGSREAHHYAESDVEFQRIIAQLVAVVVENTKHEEELVRERDRSRLLLEVTNAVVSTLDFQELFRNVCTWLRRVIRHDYTSIVLYDPQMDAVRVYALNFPAGHGQLHEDIQGTAKGSPSARAILTREAHVYTRAQLEDIGSPLIKLLLEEKILSFCSVPLFTSKSNFGALCLGSFEESAFHDEDVALLKQIAGQVAIALENAGAYQEIAQLKDKLTNEKQYLESEIRTEHNADELVGDSTGLKHVMTQARSVAPSDAAVLIQGETGTGKELVARAIHQLSARKNQSFVKVNCAAIPSGLLESELFGHEKGAFTGAISQKIGRLELANGGTLFLDEVGDIPLELQPKLLRVLQEQEFERLGSNRTIRVNVRVIAATNRELEKLVEAREFRSDLYYRLRVFPIQVPALRDRREDVPILIRYFVQKFARRMNKIVDTVPEGAMAALLAWKWPGNVRELENLIERAVILSRGPVLNVPVSELQQVSNNQAGSGLDQMLETAERDQITRVLRETHGTMSGPTGAATRLGLKRTTLQSKMRKLGISRQDFQN